MRLAGVSGTVADTFYQFGSPFALPAAGVIMSASAVPIGAVFAFTIGSIVGFAFGVLEAVLFAISGWIAGARS
jgi:hypothetical protein